MTDLTLPPKNHNQPPNELEILQDNLTLRYVSLMRDAEAKQKLSEKIPAEFAAQNEADFVSDYIAEIGHLQKSLESARKEEKEPFLRQGQAVDEFFKDYKIKLDSAVDKAKIPLTNWLKKCAAEEQARRDAEAAKLRAEAAAAVQQMGMAAVQNRATPDDIAKATQAQEAAIVADKVAAAPVVSMAAATGKYSKAGLKKEWVGTITDITKVDLEKLRAYIKPEAIQVALNAYVKMGGRACEGCSITEEVKVGVK
jgi:hypothetical protein